MAAGISLEENSRDASPATATDASRLQLIASIASSQPSSNNSLQQQQQQQQQLVAVTHVDPQLMHIATAGDRSIITG